MSLEWTDKFFNRLYWELFMKRTPEQIRAQVNLIKILTEKNDVTEILDVCCGVGDIARQLEMDLAIKATGIEYSRDYVENSYLKNIIFADACIKQQIGNFSLVLNWYSSFAYFSPEKNNMLLKNCYEYCKDVFLLESYNPYAVLSEFKKEFIYERFYQEQKFLVERKCQMNIGQRKLEQQWVFKNQNNNHTYDTFSYLYFPDEIVTMLGSIGFKNVEVHGVNVDNQLCSLELTTPRLIIKALK